MTEIIKNTKYQKHINGIVKNGNFKNKDNIFFTSDLHLFHNNILEYCNRPFKSIDAMTEGLIKNWNNKVPKNAEVYILGDLTMVGNEKYTKLNPVLKKLNGIKHLIMGNHDRISSVNYINAGIFSIHYPYLQLHNKYYMFHDPALSIACPEGSIILSGHVHNLFGKINIDDKKKIIIDVGVDSWDYKPVSLDVISLFVSEIKRLGKEKFKENYKEINKKREIEKL